MKKTVQILFALILTPLLFGAPVGNPAAPDLILKGIFSSENSSIDFRMGYMGDFVSDARLEQANGDRIDQFSQFTNSGVCTLNLVDRVDLYASLGSSDVETDWRVNNLSLGTISHMELETTTNLLWSAGGRVVLFEWCKTFLGLGGSYSSCNYRLESLKENGVAAPIQKPYFRWEQWQFNCDIAYRINLLTPYIGVKYSSVKASFFGTEMTGRIPVGLYLGCSISSGKYFMLNLEGRLIDEEAIAIFADVKF